MTRSKGVSRRLAYVKGYGGAFRGWYVEDGERKTGPFMATEEEAHHWAMRRREEVQRRGREKLADVLREVQPGANAKPSRAWDLAGSGLKSIPLRGLGHAQRPADPPAPAAPEPCAPAGAAPTPISPAEGPAPEPAELIGEGRLLGPIDLAPPVAAGRADRPAAPEPETALTRQLRTLDSVVHDFVGALDPGAATGATGEPSPLGATQFRRLLAFTPSQTQVLGPPVLFGVSPTIAMESLLGFLGYLAKTGILRVQAGDDVFMVSIVEGDVVHCVSDPRPRSELLGNILVERGILAPEELERFFEESGSDPSRIGEALNRQALVSTAELRTALEHQMLLLFDRLLGTDVSEWCFHEGEVTLAYINMRMNVIRVLLESARKKDVRGLDESAA